MDATFLLDSRLAALSCMLFSMVAAATMNEPETVPGMFRELWLRYQLFQEARRMRSTADPSERFWQIDMTKFEP